MPFNNVARQLHQTQGIHAVIDQMDLLVGGL